MARKLFMKFDQLSTRRSPYPVLRVQMLLSSGVTYSTAGPQSSDCPCNSTEVPQAHVQNKLQVGNSPVSTSRPEGPKRRKLSLWGTSRTPTSYF